ncbi:MAG: hypothetical protein IT203_02035 [Fimbriimonadaceae bacterium]|nr:hypothetical protein [Fimbriimonadaceae bacterium]
MRAPLALAFLTLSALSVAQKASYEAMREGKSVGSLTYERILQGSTQTTIVDIAMTQGTEVLKIKITSKFNAQGAPTSRTGEISAATYQVKIGMAFQSGSAKVTITNGKKSEIKMIDSKPKISIEDPSVWWFVKNKPVPKQNYRYQTISPATLAWSEVMVQYVGPGQVDLRGKKVSGHRVDETRGTERSTVWLDDKGMPLIIDQGTLKFIRK